jgi:phosphotransferase system enzyme I (PtsP)
MAARPLEALALIGVGLTAISMTPAAIGPVKSAILGLDRGDLQTFIEPLLERPDHTIRPALEDYARRTGILA